MSPPTGDHGTSAPPCAVDVVEDFNGQPVPTEGRGPVLGPRRLIAVHGRERARLEWFAILQTRADDQAVALSTAPR